MFVYRFLLTLLSPLLFALLILQVMRGRTTLSGLRIRLARGLTFSIPTEAPRIWIHATSHGAVVSARSLIEEALARDPSIHVILSTDSDTSCALVRTWDLQRFHPCLAPVDLRSAVTRFLDATRPSAFIAIERALWPNRFDLCARRGIPVIVAGARMSERASRRYTAMSTFLGGAIRTTLNAITAFAALDVESEQRFLQLGISPQRLLPRMNLVSSVSLGTVPADILAQFSAAFDRDKTLLAASLHEGEEKTVITAFRDILRKHPDTRLIIAPRHPARRADICARLDRAGLRHASRSRGDAPNGSPVYIADVLGEMALWYQLAGCCFMGNSLVDRGGHTPFEPEQFETAIIHGPHVDNHTLAYRALNAAHGAVTVTDAASLCTAWDSMLAHPDQTRDLAQAAHRALDPLRISGAGYDAFWLALSKAMQRPCLSHPRTEHHQ